MRLSSLADRVPGETKVVGPDASVTDVTHDSRLVKPGDLFVAVRGFERDGHRFVEEAMRAGAAAVSVDDGVDRPYSQLVVEDTRSALGLLAAAVHGDPSQRIAVVGVTGTNGKTTVTHLVESIVTAAGMTPGVVGTVGARVEGEHVTLPRTTPEASDLQRLLGEMVDAGVDVAAVEVSSHALALHRVNGTRFRIVAFTNLMQDHLDFHRDMGSYLSAKRLLFEPGLAERAVVAVDDQAGRSIAADVAIPVTTVALDGEADVTVRDVALTMGGSTFIVETARGDRKATLPIPGLFNIQNALVAIAIATALDIPDEAISAGLAAVRTIPGRFEPVDSGQPFGVVVDYAHTPDAIAAVIASARLLATGSIIAVVGAGGDRDREKRPAMGVAASAADVVVITSDNPRSEDPGAIIDEVVAGVPEDAAVITEPDRRRAIRTALSRAGDGDLVLILGKGHEQGQEIAGTVLPFDDRLVVAEELELWSGVEG